MPPGPPLVNAATIPQQPQPKNNNMQAGKRETFKRLSEFYTDFYD